MEHIFDIGLMVAVALYPAIVLHEYAHGWTANKLGDPTAKLAGRLTINPLRHIDPVGTVFIPGLLFLLFYFRVTEHLMIFGWAKPVPVNFLRLHNPKRDMIWVALAGPLVNIALVVFFSQLLKTELPGYLYPAVGWAILLNLGLAVFNMVPIPPLDGSRVVMGLLPNKLAYEYAKLEPYGIMIVLILLYSGFSKYLYPLIFQLASLLGVPLR